MNDETQDVTIIGTRTHADDFTPLEPHNLLRPGFALTLVVGGFIVQQVGYFIGGDVGYPLHTLGSVTVGAALGLMIAARLFVGMVNEAIVELRQKTIDFHIARAIRESNRQN